MRRMGVILEGFRTLILRRRITDLDRRSKESEKATTKCSSQWTAKRPFALGNKIRQTRSWLACENSRAVLGQLLIQWLPFPTQSRLPRRANVGLNRREIPSPHHHGAEFFATASPIKVQWERSCAWILTSHAMSFSLSVGHFLFFRLIVLQIRYWRLCENLVAFWITGQVRLAGSDKTACNSWQRQSFRQGCVDAPYSHSVHFGSHLSYAILKSKNLTNRK